MARTGVTEQEVSEAIESLEAAGLASPSIRVIHQKLGRGSLTTISRHKRAIDEERREQGVSVVPDVVEKGLREIAGNLWMEVSQAADAIIDKRDNDAEEREKTATKRIADAMEQVSEKTADVDRMKDQVNRRDKRIAELEKQLKAASKEQQAAKVELATVQSTVDGQGVQLEALKAELVENKKAFAQQVKEERQSLETKHRAALVKGEEVLSRSRDELATTAAELKSVRSSAEKEAKAHEKTQIAWEVELKEAASKLSELQDVLKTAQKSDETSKALLKQFKADVSAVKQQNQTLLKEQRALDKRNGSLEMEVARLIEQKQASEKQWKERLKEKERVIGKLLKG